MSKVDGHTLGRIRKAYDAAREAAKAERTGTAELELMAALQEPNAQLREQKLFALLQKYGEVDYG